VRHVRYRLGRAVSSTGSDVPFVVVQNLGYFNLDQFGCHDLLENAGTPTDQKWMILGPAVYGLPVYAWQLEALAFFDRVLRGTHNGYDVQPAVRYWLDGSECYVGGSVFPAPDSVPVRLYLASTGIDPAVHALLAEPATVGGENFWAAIPLGAPVLGGFDEVANQTLVYEAQMDGDVRFAGPISAHAEFSCNEIDPHIVVWFGRVVVDGSYHLLSMGTISPARRRIDAARGTTYEIVLDMTRPEPPISREKVSLAFSLTPTAVRLKIGEKLRLEVASRTDLLKSDVSRGHCHSDMAVPPSFSRDTPRTYLQLHRVQRARRTARIRGGRPRSAASSWRICECECRETLPGMKQHGAKG
jgi:uncharacterized protein